MKLNKVCFGSKEDMAKNLFRIESRMLERMLTIDCHSEDTPASTITTIRASVGGASSEVRLLARDEGTRQILT
jgi:hypothetical protein